MSGTHKCTCGHGDANDDEDTNRCSCGGDCNCTPSAETVKQVAQEQTTDSE